MRAILLAILLGCALVALVEARSTPAPTEGLDDFEDRHGHDMAKRSVERTTPPPTMGLDELEDNDRVKRAATDRLWKDDKVCYTYGEGVNNQMEASFEEVMGVFQDVSCVTFHKSKTECVDNKYVTVKGDDSGCWAHIGCNSNENLLNLADPCDMYGWGVVAHELFHTLGRNHEHIREDRDNYVTVLDANILSEKEHNFKKVTENEFGLVGKIDYDYESIMHYGRNFFSKNNQDTLELKNVKYINKIGKQEMLSVRDVATINTMYGCYAKDNVANFTQGCKHGGVQKGGKKMYGDRGCYCAPPYTGTFCETIDDKVQIVISKDADGEKTVKSTNFPNKYNENERERFLLECENTNRKVQIHFEEFELEDWGCFYDKFYFTIGSTDIYPDKYCGKQLKGETITSTDNTMYTELISDEMYTYKGYEYKFRCV